MNIQSSQNDINQSISPPTTCDSNWAEFLQLAIATSNQGGRESDHTLVNFITNTKPLLQKLSHSGRSRIKPYPCQLRRTITLQSGRVSLASTRYYYQGGRESNRTPVNFAGLSLFSRAEFPWLALAITIREVGNQTVPLSTSPDYPYSVGQSFLG